MVVESINVVKTGAVVVEAVEGPGSTIFEVDSNIVVILLVLSTAVVSVIYVVASDVDKASVVRLPLLLVSRLVVVDDITGFVVLEAALISVVVAALVVATVDETVNSVGAVVLVLVVLIVVALPIVVVDAVADKAVVEAVVEVVVLVKKVDVEAVGAIDSIVVVVVVSGVEEVNVDIVVVVGIAIVLVEKVEAVAVVGSVVVVVVGKEKLICAACGSSGKAKPTLVRNPTEYVGATSLPSCTN